ncbi:hypothetical protein [Micromonospora sp. NBC_00421]|uniref:hypothetical protein n=1 Tax=Micromonospora sp. NBC_00421 TaxID=2975976 RepID=UPI002E218F59
MTKPKPPQYDPKIGQAARDEAKPYTDPTATYQTAQNYRHNIAEGAARRSQQ